MDVFYFFFRLSFHKLDSQNKFSQQLPKGNTQIKLIFTGYHLVTLMSGKHRTSINFSQG